MLSCELGEDSSCEEVDGQSTRCDKDCIAHRSQCTAVL